MADSGYSSASTNWLEECNNGKQEDTKNVATPSNTDLLSLGDDSLSQASSVDLDRTDGRKAKKQCLTKQRAKKQKNSELLAILRKMLEDNRKMHSEKMEMYRKMLDIQKEKLLLKQQRENMKIQRENMRILTTDTSGMAPTLAAWYELKKKGILKRDGDIKEILKRDGDI